VADRRYRDEWLREEVLRETALGAAAMSTTDNDHFKRATDTGPNPRGGRVVLAG